MNALGASTSGRQALAPRGSAFLRGSPVAAAPQRAGARRVGGAALVVAQAAAAAPAETGERLRLNNLAPQPGSRRKNLRKGRGYAAGQGGSCGFGMRGQNSRSGSGTRPGFEGGQTPLYRRVPKLRGIAGGMSAGVPKYVTVNLTQLAAFKAGEEVSLQSLKERSIVNVSGKEAKLPLKVLGDGELAAALTIKAESFSESAKAKIEAAGGSAVQLPGKQKWTRAIGRKRAAAKAAAAPVKKPASK